MELKYKCECLIDQDLYVEEDGEIVGVGHACWNDASWDYHGCLICNDCRQMIEKGQSRRLTFPQYPLGEKGQQEMTRKIIEEILW